MVVIMVLTPYTGGNREQTDYRGTYMIESLQEEEEDLLLLLRITTQDINIFIYYTTFSRFLFPIFSVVTCICVMCVCVSKCFLIYVYT